jgi:RHS repeat-associated protein
VYPETPSGQNLSNVTYQYGSSGNDAGQLIYQSDATGHQEFSYGNMGEVVANVRTVIAPNLPTRVFKTNYFYDSWNRLQTMIYPDQEKVNYSYDLGGNLNRMTGQVYNEPYNYIDRIDYDYYEQRAYLKYGNKTETFYDYTLKLRRLKNLKVKTSDAQDLYNNNYQYDKVGNVTSLINQAGTTANTMGGNYGHGFEYDNLNRLAGAKGYFEGNQVQQREYNNDFQSDYNIKMEYNPTHGIVNKTQLHYKNLDATPVAANTYSNTYKYEDNTHKVVHIDDSMTGATEDFSYDLNGNLIYKTNTDGNDRSLYWDESNRLRVVNDPAGMQHYIYDASGERILKANTNTEAVYGNGSLLDPASTTINSYTTYPSANLVIDAQGIYSKHYYAGTQRIVSRIGEQSSSIFGDDCTGCKTTETDNKLKDLQKTNLQQILAKGKLGQATFKPYQPYSYDEAQKAVAEEETVAKKDNAKMPEQPPLYFYHPDHLGTSTFLTDYNGNAYQFFLNLPFGETMAEQLGSNYYNTPYKFNGKELDEETGLYYYGARYYDPRTSIWLSVDPLAEEQPNKTPYHFCSNNPINRVDPTGLLDDDYLIHKDGHVDVIRTNDKFDRFFVEETSQFSEGRFSTQLFSMVSQLDKNDAGLVQFPDSGKGFSSYGGIEKGGISSGVKKGISFTENVGSGDNYLKPETAAALFGVINELKGQGLSISFGDMSSSNGSDPANAGIGTFHHAGHGHMGKRSGLDADFRYIGNNGNSYQGEMDNSLFSVGNNKSVYEAAFRFGFDPKNTYQGTTGSVSGVKTMGGHNNHGHLGLKRNPSNFTYY